VTPPRVVARDLLRAVGVEDPQLTPDGAAVVWTRTRMVAAEDAVASEVVVTDVASGAERVIWRGRGVRLVRVAPDGASAVAVVAGMGLVRFDLTRRDVDPDAAPEMLSADLGAIRDVAFAPDGGALALVVGRLVGETRASALAPAGVAEGVLRTTRLRFKRDGGGLIGDRFDHLLYLPLTPGAPARLLVAGRVDVAGATFAPDGGSIAFVADLDDPEWERARRAGVYRIDVAGGTPRRLARFADVRAQGLAFSPDGRTLAVTGHDADGFGHYGAQRLWTIDVASGARRALTRDADGTFGAAAYTDTGGAGHQGPVWAADGGSLLAILSAGSAVRLVRVALDGAITPLTAADRVIAGFDVDAQRRRAVVVAQPRDRSADLELVDLAPIAPRATEGGKARAGRVSVDPPLASRRISDHGGALMADAVAATPVSVPVDDGRGPALDAWLLLPDERFGARVPVILYTGGGPGGMRSDNFMFEWQLFAAHGYAVVWTNARGCQGYGDPFCTAILGSWGGDDATDVLRALDAALAQFPRLDPTRQAIAGGSYGGFAAVWAVAQTDRFRCAVADRSVVDKIAAFGMSDIGPQRAFEFGGARPWEDFAAYRAQSPIDRLGGVRTPTLVIHSAEDHRCTVGQGEALFAGLLTLGVETRLIRFPNESHGLSRGGRPWHRVRRLQEYLDWFGRYLQAPAGR
jgi:dipeptidyl aminopeptidase/acylaminoacyl peptidase